MSVSATKRPPKAPKCPVGSGKRSAQLGMVRLLDETLNLFRILDSGGCFHAARDVDPERPHFPNPLAHVGGAESAGQEIPSQVLSAVADPVQGERAAGTAVTTVDEDFEQVKACRPGKWP